MTPNPGNPSACSRLPYLVLELEQLLFTLLLRGIRLGIGAGSLLPGQEDLVLGDLGEPGHETAVLGRCIPEIDAQVGYG